MRGRLFIALTLFVRVFFLTNSGRSYAAQSQFARPKGVNKLVMKPAYALTPFFRPKGEKIAVGPPQRIQNLSERKRADKFVNETLIL